MNTIVRFRTASGLYAVPVEASHEVRDAGGLVPLPGSALAGLLPRSADELPVLDVLGSGRRHVLVLDDGNREFGLLVEEVSGVVKVPTGSIGPRPAGQYEELVNGVVRIGDELILLIDVAALGRRLDVGGSSSPAEP